MKRRELIVDGVRTAIAEGGAAESADAVVLRWAIDHPKRLRSLTLINTGVLLDYEWHGFAKLWQLPLIGELSYLVLRPSLVRRMIQRTNPGPLPEAFFDRVASYADFAHHRAVLALYRASRDLTAQQDALASDLAPLDPPTLVLWGEGDAFVPVRFAERQKSSSPAPRSIGSRAAATGPSSTSRSS